MKSTLDVAREVLLRDGVILCVRLGGGVDVLEACRAAQHGGLKVFEITLTTPGALDVIRALADDEGVHAGAGTVLTPNDVAAVADAGGRFVLSPVFDPQIVDAAHKSGLLAIPGASTPTEILAAHRHGATVVKVFPAGALGGPAFLRAVRGPLPDIPLIPTNGPTADNLADYVAVGAVAVGVGGEVYPPGFTLQHVEKAARRVRDAMDRARGGSGP